VLIPLGSVFVAALAGLVYRWLSSTLRPTENVAETPQTQTELRQAELNQQKEAAKNAAPVDTPEAEAEPEPLPIMFQTMRWPLTTQYTTDKPQYYSVILYVKVWAHKTEVCRRLPTVMDRFYTSFSDVMPPQRPARAEELDAVAAEIKGAINALLPEPYILDAAVARYGTKGFRIAARPPYCWTPN